MANFIDIKDFDGVLTNADIEDLPDNVAQEIKNLKIQAGKLEKTFGAGTPSGVPYIGLTFVNSSFSPTKSYTVHNIFTFVSDKFDGDKNDAGDGYRYLLVTVEDTDQTVKLFWWDSGLPDVTDHLQVEDNIMWFQTESAHGITATDYVLVQDCKSNASPQADISGAGAYKQADHVPSTTTVGVNTNIATGWGGSFFDTTTATGITQRSFGGKCQTHLKAIDQVTHGGTAQSKIYDIAIASMNGKVLSLMLVDANQTLLVTYDGSTMADLSQTNYNSFKAKSNFKVCSMIGFNNAIYVHMSYTDSGNYNRIVKYTLSSGGAVQESLISANVSADDYTDTSFMHISSSSLYILIENNGLFKIDSSDNITEVTINVSPAPDLTKVVGLTSIRSTNNLTHSNGSGSNETHLYLFVILATSTTTKIYYSDISATGIGTGNWYAEDNFTGVTQSVSNFDFGQNSGKSSSIVLHYTNSGNHYVKYSTHDDSTVILGWADVSSSTFGTSVPISFVQKTKNSPGTDYLVVGTDDVSSPAQDNGALYLVDSSLSVQVAHAPDESTMKTWNPSCFADCITETHGGQDFFEHAKGYIAVYGTESTHGSPAVASADLYRMTDIGWLLNSWNGSGDCEYRWIDIGSRYDVGTLYHKKDRNPIIPFGDTLRVLPGNIAKVSSNEAKGAWVGWIDRSLFNGNKVYGPSFFAKENRLTNPFTFKNVELSLTDEEIRTSDTVKYTLTAVYDGVQETPIQDESIRQIVTNSGSDDNVSKSEIKLIVDLPISTMNERITGLNVYRAEKISGVYETYKLVISYSFVDTGDDSLTVSTSSDTNLITNLEAFNDKTIFVKDQDNAIKNWLNDGTVQNLTSDQGSITDNNYYDWDSPNFEYAIKVGSYEKQKIESINAITGYEATGATLNEDLTATDTTITVNNPGSISNSTVYQIGSRDSSIGTAQGGEDDNTGDYERIQVTNISGNDLTVTRGYGSTTAREHSKFDPIKADTATVTGWYKIVTDDDIKGRRHNESWKIFKEKIGLGWNTQIGTKSEGAFAGKYMGIIIPQPSEVTDGDYTMAPWRDTDGTMKISSIVGKKFTAGKKFDNNGSPISPVDTQTFKIEKAYTSWDEQLGFTFIETDKAFQSSNWTDPEVIISSFSDVSTIVSNSLNEITVIDKGLSSLGEHPYGQEDKIKVNAQYAKILKGRLFLGNIVLDPGNENEAQNDWVAYSELNAYDVRPVSNVIPFPDREGGQITGLSELFGRLIVFKAQAIFVLDVVDPSDPTTWSRKETKINIGNIAPEGIVEVHDSVYFVHHDGIYKLDANTVASSDATPSIMEKITLGIEDQFLLANDKKAVKGVYDQKNNEILYSWEEGLQYFYLDGVDDYLQDTSVTNMPSGFDVTLSAWFKTDSNGSQTVLGLYDSGSTNNYLAIGTLGGSIVVYHSFSGGSVIDTYGVGYNDNEWHHVAVTFDSSGFKNYVDGSLVETNTASSGFPTSLDTLSIGRHADSSPSNYYTGLIGGCHVFNASLTATEIGSLKTIGKSSSISGHSRFSNCIASYLMGHGSGDTTTTVQDQTSNNNDLTGTGIVQSTAQVHWAYHVNLNTWRKIDTSANLDILSFGENSGPIAWDNTDKDLKKFDVSEAVGTLWKSKRFRLDLDQKRLIRYGMVKFTGIDSLIVNIYLDGSSGVSFTKTISVDGGVNRFPIKRYGKNFEIELKTASSTNSFSVEQMRIETE